MKQAEQTFCEQTLKSRFFLGASYGRNYSAIKRDSYRTKVGQWVKTVGDYEYHIENCPRLRYPADFGVQRISEIRQFWDPRKSHFDTDFGSLTWWIRVPRAK